MVFLMKVNDGKCSNLFNGNQLCQGFMKWLMSKNYKLLSISSISFYAPHLKQTTKQHLSNSLFVSANAVSSLLRCDRISYK